jgi:hypothetical protein
MRRFVLNYHLDAATWLSCLDACGWNRAEAAAMMRDVIGPVVIDKGLVAIVGQIHGVG